MSEFLAFEYIGNVEILRQYLESKIYNVEIKSVIDDLRILVKIPEGLKEDLQDCDDFVDVTNDNETRIIRVRHNFT